jgi:hypothetical protein
MSRKDKIINAFFKDWMYGYSWIPEFWKTDRGNIDNLRAWLQRQPNEKAYLGLRSSLVATMSTMHFYANDPNGEFGGSKMPLKVLTLPDASLKPTWESLKHYNITTVGELLPYMIPAIELLDRLWSNTFVYHAINNQTLLHFFQ